MTVLKQGCTLQGGKYRIESVLGQGGFGITYSAIQVSLNRCVAIKEFFMKDYCERDSNTSQVTLGTSNGAQEVKRFKEKFMKEAALIAQFNNPHIVRIYDIFEENGTAYYVMELLENRWNEFGRKGILEELSLNIIRQVWEGLSYIHALNVLHLDVKPSNIMFRKDCAVLIDFGISKRYDNEGGQTSSTPVGISKGYAPLEQYNQGIQKFQPATDIYSLGATLYKYLTGETPPDASEVNEDGVIKMAMQPRKKDRPQSIQEFLAILDTNAKRVESRTDEETVFLKESSTSQFLTITVNGVSFKMIRVEGGTFKMGATPEQKNESIEEQSFLQRLSNFFTTDNGAKGPDEDELPVHEVVLSSYYIGESQVTQALWEAVMDINPSEEIGENYPVNNVSWNDCQKFLKKLNNLTGKNFRLPTEAEWEYAARGGNKSKGYKYSGSNNLDEVAWYKDNSNDEAHDVMMKLANELGLYDMSGNISEWCSDWYDFYEGYIEGEDYSTSSPQFNPAGPSCSSARVFRGGDYMTDTNECRVSCRRCWVPSLPSQFNGLRLAL